MWVWSTNQVWLKSEFVGKMSFAPHASGALDAPLGMWGYAKHNHITIDVNAFSPSGSLV